MQSRPGDQASSSGDRTGATVAGAEATTIGGRPSNTSATNPASGIIFSAFRPGCCAEV
jgi:hypothetical protein